MTQTQPQTTWQLNREKLSTSSSVYESQDQYWSGGLTIQIHN